MKKQKSIIVNEARGTDKLNSLLEEGWLVMNTCPMPSSISTTGSLYNVERFQPTCLVILEKEIK